jgi:threonine synthase
LEIAHTVAPVTLYEGNTPLIPASRLAAEVAPGAELFLKYEGLNPTGSFKDRGMTTAITQAVADGATAIICASTGNTAASAAAYAARAGLKCAVLIPDGKVALGKLAGAIAYGAEVIAIRGSFDDGLNMVRAISASGVVTLVNSVNPARIEGQKTAAWEVIDQLGAPPDWLCLPVGNAGNITAYWLGFQQSGDPRLPRLLGAQAEGAAPIVNGERVVAPETVATAIRIGNPARWEEASSALRESRGMILAVRDTEIVEMQRLIAALEGVYCEPSSAAGLAGLRKALQEGRFEAIGQRVVAVLTGHGMKDPDTTISGYTMAEPIEPTLEALRARLESR